MLVSKAVSVLRLAIELKGKWIIERAQRLETALDVRQKSAQAMAGVTSYLVSDNAADDEAGKPRILPAPCSITHGRGGASIHIKGSSWT
jgi:hypothetical protein